MSFSPSRDVVVNVLTYIRLGVLVRFQTGRYGGEHRRETHCTWGHGSLSEGAVAGICPIQQGCECVELQN